MEKKDKLKKQAITIFWVFIIGSFFGSVVETAVEILIDKNLNIRQGLIYGPFIPVYGIGAVMYYLVVSKIKDPIKVFFVCMVLGGFVEYASSLFQELFFGTISWDYSNATLNLNGRTDLMHCIFWGLTGIFYITIAYPYILKFVSNYNRKDFKALTIVMLIFMMFNISVSWAAGRRQNERVLGIAPKNKLDEVIDKYYPDSKMDKIYFNKITVVKKQGNNVNVILYN